MPSTVTREDRARPIRLIPIFWTTTQRNEEDDKKSDRHHDDLTDAGDIRIVAGHMRKIIFLLILLLLSACQKSEEDQLAELGYLQEDIVLIQGLSEENKGLFLSEMNESALSYLRLDSFKEENMKEYLSFDGILEKELLVDLINRGILTEQNKDKIVSLYSSPFFIKEKEETYGNQSDAPYDIDISSVSVILPLHLINLLISARCSSVIDLILAAGGGSVADCCKVISAQACLDKDIWDYEYEEHQLPQKFIPYGAIVTASGTGAYILRGLRPFRQGNCSAGSAPSMPCTSSRARRPQVPAPPSRADAAPRSAQASSRGREPRAWHQGARTPRQQRRS